MEKLKDQVNELREKEEEAPVVLDADITAFTEHYREVLAELRARERQLLQGEGSRGPSWAALGRRWAGLLLIKDVWLLLVEDAGQSCFWS